MSNASAIATVTATLQHLLTQTTNAASVTTMPPSVARDEANTASQLNLFLYKTDVNTAFSNSPMPGSSRPNETVVPPLALTLRYLLTSYGEDDDDISGQEILGESMLAFHDHMVLSRAMIDGIAPDSDLHNQVERVRITVDPITTDEMTKLWSVFQTGYRISQAYEVSVALLESERPGVSPLPVLRRGAADEGAFVQTGIDPPFPQITEIEFENENIDAEAGEAVVFRGSRLEVAGAAIRFDGLRLAAPIDVPAAAIAPDAITIQMPAPLGGIPAGIYRVQALLPTGGDARLTNALSLPVVPQISNIQVAGAPNARELTLTIGTDLAPGQEAVLLMGGEQFSDPAVIAPFTLRFALGAIPSGDYLVRLRVDGVDSRHVDRTAEPPAFIAGIEVNIP